MQTLAPPATNVAGTAAGPNAPPGALGQVISMGGMRAVPLAVVENERMQEEQAARTQATPLVSGLVGHIRSQFEIARTAKRNTVEQRLMKSIRQRRSEYDPEKLAEIQLQGGSQVYAGLTSTKCRAAGGWIRDVLMGTGSERPWAIRPTPIADLPVKINDILVAKVTQSLGQLQMQGVEPTDDQVLQITSNLKDQAATAVREEARKRADRMADKMEDQLIEGGFLEALDSFIDDLTTYPTAFLKGPVIRRKPVLTWGPGDQPVVTPTLTTEWERVSPFNMYPSPAADHVQDGSMIEKHQLSRKDLNEMIGVEGYDEASIKTVLDMYSKGGLISWLEDGSQQAAAEGKDTSTVYQNPDGLIDALQYWGSVPGTLLLDWGLTKRDIPDKTKEYHVEAWLIGSHVIKAVLNYDPLCRKPYYAASYEKIPGSIWGNSVADLVRDAQTVVNASARALINNMALSSGPQVGILTDRLAPGEDVTQLAPWRIWQMTESPLAGSTQQPITFFQPNSNAPQLLQVFEKFSELADEYSGIPRYLSGDASGGAGRTASGLSMLISNAGKSIKQVINNIDIGVMKPMLDRLYYHNMRYLDDPDLKGDVGIIARGAAALVAKEATQIRRNEFLAATANPIDMQIVGVEGRAAILRETAKNLDMDADKIVPTVDILRQKLQAQQALAAPAPPGGQGGTPADPTINGQTLMDGAPVTDNF